MPEESDTRIKEAQNEPRRWRPWRQKRRQTRWHALWAVAVVATLGTITLLVIQLVQLSPGLWKDGSREPVAILEGRVPTLIGIGVALAVLIALLAIGGASLGWTGFGEKKLWDWLQLLSALAIPIVLAAAGFWFTMQLDVRQQAIEDQRAERERELEEQRAQDEALQAYLDQMSTLLLKEDLRSPDEDSGVETQTLARARTLTVLGRLGPDRKRSVIEFLTEASLIKDEAPALDLAEADLRKASLSGTNLKEADLGSADLSGANLNSADLSSADLNSADLSDANLREADLSGANLKEANLKEANLSGANLSGADLNEGESHTNPGVFTPDKEANLSGANLSGADLSNAKGVTGESLEQQKTRLGLASMPDGTGHAGQYDTVEFEPQLSISVSDGWQLGSSEMPDELFIDGPGNGGLVFTSPLQLFDWNAPQNPKVKPAPNNAAGWASWFRRHPNLETSAPVVVKVGGKSAVQIDVTATSAPDDFSPYYCGVPCVLLYPSGDSAIVAFPNYSKEHFVIVNVQGETVLINVGAPEEEFDEFLLKAQKVLDTVEWESE